MNKIKIRREGTHADGLELLSKENEHPGAGQAADGMKRSSEFRVFGAYLNFGLIVGTLNKTQK